ncbi:glycosyl hydrolase family 95 catalytic domain-containing protein [Viscerimonas tarda]
MRKVFASKFLSAFIFVLISAKLFAGSDNLKVDWKTYMSDFDLVWNKLPQKLWEAPFMGNGLMGSYMVYEPALNAFRFNVDRSDVHDHRQGAAELFCRPRLFVGHFLLKPQGKIIGCNMRTDIYNAETTGEITTDKGAIIFKAYIHTAEMAMIVEATASAAEEVAWEWVSGSPNSPRYDKLKASGDKSKQITEYVENAPAVVDSQNKTALFSYLEGGQTAVSWAVTKKNRTQELYVACSHTYPQDNALQLSQDILSRVKKQSASSLQKSHRSWWNNFYKRSFVSLPDKKIENFYWIQLYKLACATRSDRAMIDNLGPWMSPTIWPDIWWNLNAQLTYWTTYPSNHSDLSASLSNAVFTNVDNLINNVPEKYRHNSAGLGRASAFDLVSAVKEAGGVKDGPELGLLTWACHNVWLEYRHSMDRTILEKLFPVLKRSINYYIHFLRVEDDNKYHLPSSYSPEYGSAADCNFDLSLLKWGCQTLLEADSILGANDPLKDKWKDIADRLVDFPADAYKGWMIGRNVAYDKSHRHYSHLLMAFPLYVVNRDQEGGAAMIEKSVNYWQSLKGALEGYSRTGAASLYASIGDGNTALNYLNEFMEKSMQPNTFYHEGTNPVIETPLSGARALLDMAFQSWGGKIRVFPAIPTTWNDFAFDNLRAEGAFDVSAVRKDRLTQFVRIYSHAGEPCVLECRFAGDIRQKGKRIHAIKKLSNNVYEIDLKAGEEIILYDNAGLKDFAISPVQSDFNRKVFGLNDQQKLR